MTRRNWSALRAAPAKVSRLALLLVAVVLLAGLSSCGAADDKTLTLATILPTTGTDAAVGQAMQRAVDLAVKQNATLDNGYSLTVAHYDEASGADGLVETAVADPHVLGIVGPYGSQSALVMLPQVAQNGIATISPGVTLPGLTQESQASAEGIAFSQLHPQGKSVTFFRLPQTDDALGKAAADLAVASTKSHGFQANDIFVADDGTASGKTIAAAFVAEFKAKHGTIDGQKSVTPANTDSAPAAVSAIVATQPDIVFYGGGTDGGALLRSTLTLSGVPNIAVLAAGPVADNPGFGDAVGVKPTAANTTGILPAQEPTKLDSAKDFVAAYQAAYSGQILLPQSALAYDAAMVEIAAIKSVIKSGQAPTRSAVVAAVAAAKYTGVTGAIAFDKNGDNTTPLGFAVYTCDAKGAWHFQANIAGS
ncbi:MAG TPA: branched-chain amino acid ABC transporter substrate-binding protein [Ktedonobacterales bacterium]|nr:branched-chain amino acid ABC transporter substrate-binding protein [Ktedonobacterales bacterium]